MAPSSLRTTFASTNVDRPPTILAWKALPAKLFQAGFDNSTLHFTKNSVSTIGRLSVLTCYNYKGRIILKEGEAGIGLGHHGPGIGREDEALKEQMLVGRGWPTVSA